MGIVSASVSADSVEPGVLCYSPSIPPLSQCSKLQIPALLLPLERSPVTRQLLKAQPPHVGRAVMNDSILRAKGGQAPGPLYNHYRSQPVTAPVAPRVVCSHPFHRTN